MNGRLIRRRGGRGSEAGPTGEKRGRGGASLGARVRRASGNRALGGSSAAAAVKKIADLARIGIVPVIDAVGARGIGVDGAAFGEGPSSQCEQCNAREKLEIHHFLTALKMMEHTYVHEESRARLLERGERIDRNIYTDYIYSVYILSLCTE